MLGQGQGQLIGVIILAFPYIFYEFWCFISLGLSIFFYFISFSTFFLDKLTHLTLSIVFLFTIAVFFLLNYDLLVLHAFLISAAITPSDLLSMFIAMIPLLFR